MKISLKNLKINMVLSLLFLVFFLFCPKNIFAIENPLVTSNNKFGIHILFPEELNEAAKLVNSGGGDWGYVTIPIQETDRNLKKWQTFFHKARELHVIPLVRLATTADYFNTNIWQKPTYETVLDFANFLNSLDWPTKNRYIIVFNEPNRNAEWGGKSDPLGYADILDYAVSVFKKVNPDFFIISAGLDNGADTNSESINQYEFLEKMGTNVPNVFARIDGMSSHAYPNPGFSQPPTVISKKSISSFLYESYLIKNISGKSLPVFITETGWSNDRLSDKTIASYYKNALGNVWSNPNIVTITPFLLEAGAGIFSQFSFLDKEQTQSAQYKALKNMAKIEGKPTLADNKNIGNNSTVEKIASFVEFNTKNTEQKDISSKINQAKTLLKWFLRI